MSVKNACTLILKYSVRTVGWTLFVGSSLSLLGQAVLIVLAIALKDGLLLMGIPGFSLIGGLCGIMLVALASSLPRQFPAGLSERAVNCGLFSLIASLLVFCVMNSPSPQRH